MSELKTVSIAVIDDNPFRAARKYPLDHGKLKAITRSIEAVGLWEGVIARRKGRRYELAFGHHRIAAAKRVGLKKVALVVRDLDDRQMVEFMGRENMEDYNSDFLAMLNSWEAGVTYLRDNETGGADPDQKQVAALLGWVRADAGKAVRANDCANACHSVLSLVKARHMKRSDFKGLSVKSAREIAQRTFTRIREIESIAQTRKTPKPIVDKAKRRVAKAATVVAELVTEGEIPAKGAGRKVDYYAHVESDREKGPRILEADLAFQRVSNQIQSMIDEDSVGSKLFEIREALPFVRQDPKATRALGRICFELKELRGRCQDWETSLKRDPKVEKDAKIHRLVAVGRESV